MELIERLVNYVSTVPGLERYLCYEVLTSRAGYRLPLALQKHGCVRIRALELLALTMNQIGPKSVRNFVKI